MSDDTNHDQFERTPEEPSDGFSGADIVGVLAVTSFLAAIALTTFFLTTALAH